MPLPRIPEPRSIDPRGEAADYHAMDHVAVNQAFVEDFRSGKFSVQGLPIVSGPRVMDLGCGSGQIPILLCQADENVQMIALDNEIEMLEIAKIEIDIAGMLSRIDLQHGDIADIPAYDSGMADAVISNTVMHHLDDPAAGIATAVRLARPGGRVFIRDLFRPGAEPELELLVEKHGDGQSRAGQQLLRQSLHAALSMDEVLEITSKLGLQGLGEGEPCVQMTSDRHWTLDWTKPTTT